MEDYLSGGSLKGNIVQGNSSNFESIGTSVELEEQLVYDSMSCMDVKNPIMGMEFNSIEEAKDYYTELGRQKGHSIRVRSSNKRRRGDEVTNVKFVCQSEGFHQKKKSQEIEIGLHSEEKRRRSGNTVREGCKAFMSIVCVKGTTKWKVTRFNDEHNHRLVTPSKKILMTSNRCMPDAARDLTESFNRENLQIGKVPSIFGGGSVVGFDDRDCWNHLRSMRHKNLDSGDAHAVITFFRRKQSENPHFFYAVQCDEDGRATNFFWVDARSRMSYEYFGDVVAFDTTYRTNKYEMPFAPFTGVNHHYQSVLFGCALLQDESEATFIWLFETWLEAMGGRHPVSIITDQDLAIGGAVAKVFLHSRHRYCLWHIKKKFAEKLSSVYFKKSNFKQAMKKCIHYTYTIEEFELQWNSLILEFELTENDWLKSLYEIRHFWIPVYNRGSFFAGMNTTGRSESMNSFFDGFVSSKINLRDFVAKYEQALDKIYLRERKEDYISIYKKRILDNNMYMLLSHAANIYTRNIFKKFQNEFDQVARYKTDECNNHGVLRTFKVMTKCGTPEEFNVVVNLNTKEAKCGCQHFEFMGIMCRHLLKVFDRLDEIEIPSHFILKRWTKEANRGVVMSGDGLLVHYHNMGSEAMRISHICRRSTQLALMAAKSEDAYKIAMEMIDEGIKKVSLIEQVSLMDMNETDEDPEDIHATRATSLGSTTQSILLDPHISQTKGRKRTEKVNENVTEKTRGTGRWKSSIEVASKKQRKCKLCGGQGHDSRNCPIYPRKKKSDSTVQSLNNEALDLESDDGSDSTL